MRDWRRPRRSLMVLCSAASLLCGALQLVLGFPWDAAFCGFTAALCLGAAYIPKVEK